MKRKEKKNVKIAVAMLRLAMDRRSQVEQRAIQIDIRRDGIRWRDIYGLL